MKKLLGILLLSLSIIMLIACSKNNDKSLDGEYYWISSERNGLTLTIKGILIPLSWKKPIVFTLINISTRSN